MGPTYSCIDKDIKEIGRTRIVMLVFGYYARYLEMSHITIFAARMHGNPPKGSLRAALLVRLAACLHPRSISAMVFSFSLDVA